MKSESKQTNANVKTQNTALKRTAANDKKFIKYLKEKLALEKVEIKHNNEAELKTTEVTISGYTYYGSYSIQLYIQEVYNMNTCLLCVSGSKKSITLSFEIKE